MQNLALTLSLLVMAAIAALFLWVVAGASRAGGDAGAIATSAFRWRDRLFWIVIATGVVVTLATLWPWPIAGACRERGEPDVVIRAAASQWRWELDRDTVAPGQFVEFETGQPRRQSRVRDLQGQEPYGGAGPGHARIREQAAVALRRAGRLRGAVSRILRSSRTTRCVR